MYWLLTSLKKVWIINLSDRQLILRIKAGDLHAFRHLVDRHKDVCLTLACSILKDRDHAEDVLQEVFIKVYENMDSFKFQSALTTWLYRIVVNTSYTVLKNRNRYGKLKAFQEVSAGLQEQIGPGKLVEEEQKRYISEALKRLKTDEALVLRMFYLCEMRIKEISEITSFSAAKIKVDLHRGRANLETELRKMLGSELNSLL